MGVSALNVNEFDSLSPVREGLFRHVNGRWYDESEIPADRARWGTFDELRQAAQEAVRVIITELEADGDPASEVSKIAGLYASFMDEEAAQSRGAQPIAPLLDRVSAIASVEDLASWWGWSVRHGVGALVALGYDADPGDPSRYRLFVVQSGIGLPDEAYYRLDEHAEIREKYLAHIEASLRLAGVEDPAGQAKAAFELETAIAACHWDKVRKRDLVAMYHPLTWDEFVAETPGLAWEAFRAGADLPLEAAAELVSSQHTFLPDVAPLVTEDRLDQWRSWARWRVVNDFSAYLSDEFVEEDFDFYSRTLSGVPQIKDRWKRGVELTEAFLGEAIGKLYVAEHFPPEHKAQVEKLVTYLLEAYRRSITALEWMTETTKQEALRKLDGFMPMIGYPEKWRDYSKLTIAPDDLVGNIIRGSSFEFDDMIEKLSGPVDRGEWSMYPQTVNAYYHPLRNVIVFPAAIIQPPYFDPEADDALNFGGIGAVIGHEIGHGFDDQGSMADGEGRVRDWWTAEDKAAFHERTGQLVSQYEALSPAAAPEVHLNGKLTLGENIGDLGGLSIAYLAWTISREGTEPDDAPIDGYTPQQRLFLSWARVWRGKSRPENARELVAVDPHSPTEIRCDQTPKNIDAFHEAFGTEPGDAMWLDPSERVSIW
ncbi:MAG: peptidase M13 [Propionibacteriaceae bacterium]|jgi:putative endopeptidase|nr:peptidase M13 [Propionibacteriaceae bacterium]